MKRWGLVRCSIAGTGSAGLFSAMNRVVEPLSMMRLSPWSGAANMQCSSGLRVDFLMLSLNYYINCRTLPPLALAPVFYVPILPQSPPLPVCRQWLGIGDVIRVQSSEFSECSDPLNSEL